MLLRRRFDLDPTPENEATYKAAEKYLSEEEHAAYLALYRKVSNPTNQE